MASKEDKSAPALYSITAEVDIPKGGVEGVLLSVGGNDDGITFYIQGQKLCFAHNYIKVDYFYVNSGIDIPEGNHVLGVEFSPAGKAKAPKGKGTPGIVILKIDGKTVGKVKFPIATTVRLEQGIPMRIGADTEPPVIPDYESPFIFTGKIRKVIVDVN